MPHSVDPAEEAASAILRPGQTTYHVKNLAGFNVSEDSITAMELKIHTKALADILNVLKDIREMLEVIASV